MHAGFMFRPKIAPFDRVSTKARLWTIEFRNAVEGLNDGTTHSLFREAMRGPAAEWLERERQALHGATRDQLLANLRQEFEPPRADVHYRRQLRALVQEPEESVLQLRLRALGLVDAAYPGEAVPRRRELALEYFVNALRPEIREQVRSQGCDTTFDEAYRAAGRIEQAILLEMDAESRKSSVALVAPVDERRCWKCKSRDHIKRDCPQSRNDFTASGQRNRVKN